MMVAGHYQNYQEERRRAPASHLIECTKVCRQQAQEFSSGLGKPERFTWGDRGATKNSSEKELHHEASPLSSATLLMRIRCML